MAVDVGTIAVTKDGRVFKKTGTKWVGMVEGAISYSEEGVIGDGTYTDIVYTPPKVSSRLGNGSIIESTQEAGVVAIRDGGLWSVVGVTRYYDDEEVHKLFGGQYKVVRREVKA